MISEANPTVLVIFVFKIVPTESALLGSICIKVFPTETTGIRSSEVPDVTEFQIETGI